MYRLANVIEVLVYQIMERTNGKISSAMLTFDLVLIKSRFGLSRNFGAQIKLSA